jgi:hypothetical protein
MVDIFATLCALAFLALYVRGGFRLFATIKAYAYNCMVINFILLKKIGMEENIAFNIIFSTLSIAYAFAPLYLLARISEIIYDFATRERVRNPRFM